MSEVTEFLVWRSALGDMPARITALGGEDTTATEIYLRMAHTEAVAVATLEHLIAGRAGPAPEPAGPEGGDPDPLARLLALRRRLLDLLDRVDLSNLHAATRLASGRPLDPWRLAGDLADHDVRCLAELRAARQPR